MLKMKLWKNGNSKTLLDKKWNKNKIQMMKNMINMLQVKIYRLI